jgi:hypothetical protein
MLAWQIRHQDTSDWVVTWDLFEPLQFCAYVGHTQGYAPADVHVPQTPLEHAWQQWWEQMTTATLDYQADLDTTLRTHVNLPTQQLIHVLRSPGSLPYDPPLFDSLQHWPALQTLCQERWADFPALWSLEKPRLFAKLRQQGKRVPDNRVVRRAARTEGRSEVTAFFLRIDFVRWPEVYQRQRAPNHVVLGTHYLDASAAEALENILLRVIQELV